ncbi:helix-turn-helix domain-containing protein [Noviherbaspirillum sp. CPCC 100848]|uniref:Helix-turn-helix domain-containing protein n=1 Tax=Noviherbaspirillum album TaxID=3080276 RepID=A0ABU6J474_9BURK|nr:helix-turn-helix domain-containing protein [Noviherbaspirillum sp. CPCC 100848]MEC4718414.1 helix-turn-helix domain-containing protein [Noviherbaspirillum sp. CPCC 100848]
MKDDNLSIGALAKQVQCTVPTIRYYEEIGLLPHATRAANGRRYYGDADHMRLLFIKRCRDFGFPIEQVRNLVSLFEEGDRSCVEVRDVAQEHLSAVRAKIAEFRQLEASLVAFVDSCNTACCGGTAKDCTIIEDLSSTAGPASAAGCGGGASMGVPADTPGFISLKRR